MNIFPVVKSIPFKTSRGKKMKRKWKQKMKRTLWPAVSHLLLEVALLEKIQQKQRCFGWDPLFCERGLASPTQKRASPSCERGLASGFPAGWLRWEPANHTRENITHFGGYGLRGNPLNNKRNTAVFVLWANFCLEPTNQKGDTRSF